VLGAVFAFGLYRAVAVDAALLRDPRYETENFLNTHARTGETVEAYGLNVNLPRFPPFVRVQRVDQTPLRGRNPMPGIEEVEARFADVEARAPSWIVVPEAWSWRYTIGAEAVRSLGRVLTAQQSASLADRQTTRYFGDLMEGKTAYQLVHMSQCEAGVFPPINLHASTCRPVRLFQRAR
jgi:hypothetical protein